jgi:8-oxo-dGTP pyrophosphatase MutT (NUDIX family)
LILKHKKGHWSFAKGHREKGETSIDTAKRELLEEAGIDDVKFISKKILLKEKYTFLNRDDFEVRKEVSYFIAGTKTKRVKIDKKEIINYEWCTLKAAEKLITYKQSRKTIKKADSLITKYLKLT